MTKQNELLVEIYEDVPIIITEEADDGYRYATFLVSRGDFVNRNSRAYPLSIWKREASRIKSANVTGQAGHPEWMAGTNPLNQFLLFREGVVDGSEFRATARIMPTEEGKKFTTLAEGGMKFAVSTRGEGSTKSVEEYKDYKEIVHANVSVVQDDYKLRGIDILCPGDQSVDGAHMLRFEAVEEDDVKELQEKLDEALVTITEANVSIEGLEEDKKRLERELAEKDGIIGVRDGALSEKEEAATNFQQSLSKKDNEIACLSEQVDVLEGQAAELVEQVATLMELNEARSHLLEKVKGETFAIPLMNKLFNEPTTVAVEDAWETALKEAEDEMSGLPDGTPKGRIDAKAGDGLEEVEDESQPDVNFPHLRRGGLA